MRTLTLTLLCSLLCSLLWACGDDGTAVTGDGGLPDGAIPVDDQDGDGISDADEDRPGNRDTDGDGIPDYQDSDSDGDGIFDFIEGSPIDRDPATPPIDTDGDGLPDFIDTDSDGNGRSDSEDGLEDWDGDGLEDFRDLDDDNDFVNDVLELGPMALPLDFDGDGIPDFLDPDSDDDFILDGHERPAMNESRDTDGDGTPDWKDDDSDGDGILDSVEAGDSDIRTAPVDSDGDGVADYRDPDSDNDGVSDASEREAGTSTTSSDTDMDGVSDLIEIGAGTDPLSAADSPRTRGDFVFVVPFQEDTEPLRDTLNFETSLQFADIYFNVDITGSMSQELTALGSPTTGIRAIVEALSCTESGVACADRSACAVGEVCNRSGMCAEDPRAGDDSCIPDIWTGVGTFEDLDSYENLLSLQADSMATATAVPTRTGSGGSEAPFQAPACIADPTNCTNAPRCAAMGVGCPGFRPEAVRIVIQITDANDQCSGARCSMFTAATAGAALIAENIKFIGLWGTGDETGSGTAQSVAADIAIASDSLDSDGNPLVFPALDAAVAPETITAVRTLVNGDNFRVSIDPSEQPDDDGDALRFIDQLVVNVSGVAGCTYIAETEDSDMDGDDDAFSALRPGIPVCWDVIPFRNDCNDTSMADADHPCQMPTTTPLVYKALLTVRADGSEVDSRNVFFLVPPRIPNPDVPE